MRLIEVIFVIALIHQTHTVSFLWQITRVIVYNTRQSVTVVSLMACLVDWYSNGTRISTQDYGQPVGEWLGIMLFAAMATSFRYFRLPFILARTVFF
jgi:hypothetical protein